MPDRDYYLRQDASFEATRTAYVRYITTMLRLAKQPDRQDVRRTGRTYRGARAAAKSAWIRCSIWASTASVSALAGFFCE